MKKSILVIASHPDDETIGCGGTILRHVNDGHTVNIITLTNGVSSRGHLSQSNDKERSIAAKNAMKILGANWLGAGDFPDNLMDSIPFIRNNKIHRTI